MLLHPVDYVMSILNFTGSGVVVKKNRPLWLKARPTIYPNNKEKQASCGHAIYYLDPHDKCMKCREFKCDFTKRLKCYLCKPMKQWAVILCRRDMMRKRDRGMLLWEFNYVM